MTTEAAPPREPMLNLPGVVLALAALLTVLHLLLAFLLTAEETSRLFALFAFNPLRYADVVVPPAVLSMWWGPQIWTFLSYAFIHANLNHLIFNLVWLLAFGSPIARRFGAWRFLAFCAATAAAGAVAHLVTHFGEYSPMIGASAAVSGTMAAAMRFVFQRGGPLGLIASGDEASYQVPAAPLSAMLRDPRVMGFVAVWFGVNVVFGIGVISMPGAEGSAVAWEAHIGGFVAGLLGFALFDPVRADAERSPPISADDEPIDRP